MQTISVPTPVASALMSLTLRLCVMLSITHAILVTGGLYIVWAVRSFTRLQTFAHALESTWLWLLVSWPMWWIVYFIVSRQNWRYPIKPMIGATVIWLFTAIPAVMLLWSLRDFR